MEGCSVGVISRFHQLRPTRGSECNCLFATITPRWNPYRMLIDAGPNRT
jgi:hypothetical protein